MSLRYPLLVPSSLWPQFTCRGVKNASTLVSAFNTKSNSLISFSLKEQPTGLFGIPELKNADGFFLLKQQAIFQSEDLVIEGCSPQRKRRMVEIFDELSNSLCRVADLAEFIRLAHPDAKYRYTAQEAAFSIGTLVEQLNVNRPLYDELRTACEKGDILDTSPIDDHVAKLFLFDFEQCGIHLSEKRRDVVAKLNEAILSIGQKFMHNCHLPKQVSRSSLDSANRYTFGLVGEHVTVGSLHSDSPCESKREAAYRIYLSPDNHQERLLQQMLSARQNMATLCGFKSFGHRALGGSLAETPEMVSEFLCSLSDGVRDMANADYTVIRDMKHKDNSDVKDVCVWDIPYYTGLAKQELLINDLSGRMPELSHYFPLGSVMEGMKQLFSQLFGVSLELCRAQTGELWAEDVHKLAVVEESNGDLLGHIYCDFIERRGKPRQDCHFTIRGGKLLSDGTYQTPVVVVQLSLPPASWSVPPLLSPSMLDNLFHEMGHAMHSMLARTRYQHVTGTRCSTDFAEVPSILMEYFVSDKRVLRTFARHYSSGDMMPEELMDVMLRSKAVFSASELQTQVFYSAVDQRLHGTDDLENCNTSDIVEEEHHRHYGLPFVKNTAWQLRFSHFFGYGGKYYAYLVSRAVASWIWNKYFRDDPMNSTSGWKYRTEVLQHGGGVPSRQLVGSFLNKEISAQSLSDALLADLEDTNEQVGLRG